MAQKRKVTDKNLYELLEILSSATEKEIKQAYRKKALKCHPDKNPDNPKAAELFHELSEALEILTDEKAKEAYDRTLKAKELAKERLKELDSKRRKLKEDLERREQAAREDEKARAALKKSYSTAQANLSEEECLQKEIERLRKEGSRALQEEQELIRQQILKEQEGKFSFLSTAEDTRCTDGPRIKIKWAKGSSPPTYDSLMQSYSSFGKVVTLVVGKKCAIIEYKNQKDADEAFNDESLRRQFSAEWLSKATQQSTKGTPQTNDEKGSNSTCTSAPSNQGFGNSSAVNPGNFADFEAMILNRLSAAAAAQKQTSEVSPESKS